MTRVFLFTMQKAVAHLYFYNINETTAFLIIKINFDDFQGHSSLHQCVP